MNVLEELLNLSGGEILRIVLLLLVAFVLALPLGFDREKRNGGAGLRTFPIVAMASCGFMLVGLVEYESPEAQARLAYGIITGIGFIGGGAILKRDGGDVSGVATAASIWSTGAIGMAVAHRRFEIAIALALVNFLTFWFGRWVKPQVSHKEKKSAPDPS